MDLYMNKGARAVDEFGKHRFVHSSSPLSLAGPVFLIYEASLYFCCA